MAEDHIHRLPRCLQYEPQLRGPDEITGKAHAWQDIRTWMLSVEARLDKLEVNSKEDAGRLAVLEERGE